MRHRREGKQARWTNLSLDDILNPGDPAACSNAMYIFVTFLFYILWLQSLHAITPSAYDEENIDC